MTEFISAVPKETFSYTEKTIAEKTCSKSEPSQEDTARFWNIQEAWAEAGCMRKQV